MAMPWCLEGTRSLFVRRVHAVAVVFLGLIAASFLLNSHVYLVPSTGAPTEGSICLENAVVSMAYGYSLDRFEQFLYTLRLNFCGRIILFTEPNAEKRILKLMENLDVTNHPVKRKEGMRPEVHRLLLNKEACAPPLRWCLFTDFRDVFFQAGAESWDAHLPHQVDLIFAEEDQSATMGRSMHNSEWIRQCHGNEGVQELSNYSIVCSGTFIGTPRGTRILMDKMVSEVTGCNGSGIVGMDQGHMNWIVRKEIVALGVNYTAEQRRKGVINTVGLVKAKSLLSEIDQGGDFLTQTDGITPSPVVHQYDRFPELKEIAVRHMQQAKKALSHN
eukprot:CAMPEP_0197452360 /NCGR_PEP_ID=MMETSP1175-20131217/31868_1 /TAXON_ID=1003142 /ORGANISM="Triceratium dubium, Strain CCMP147" /LENGTH=330 /DNA_ID=CAMNT_0042985345 /DNA_START=112 /DNA_END=1104 /DNA_ORIENTATION=+